MNTFCLLAKKKKKGNWSRVWTLLLADLKHRRIILFLLSQQLLAWRFCKRIGLIFQRICRSKVLNLVLISENQVLTNCGVWGGELGACHAWRVGTKDTSSRTTGLVSDNNHSRASGSKPFNKIQRSSSIRVPGPWNLLQKSLAASTKRSILTQAQYVASIRCQLSSIPFWDEKVVVYGTYKIDSSQ